MFFEVSTCHVCSILVCGAAIAEVESQKISGARLPQGMKRQHCVIKRAPISPRPPRPVSNTASSSGPFLLIHCEFSLRIPYLISTSGLNKIMRLARIIFFLRLLASEWNGFDVNVWFLLIYIWIIQKTPNICFIFFLHCKHLTFDLYIKFNRYKMRNV